MIDNGKRIVSIVIAVLLVIAVVAVFDMNNKYDVIENYDELKEEAVSLYDSGEKADAITALETYCQYVVTDIESRALLGDWYLEAGDEEKAYEAYYQAANNKIYTEETMPTLTVKNTTGILIEPVTKVSLEITPDVRITKNMTLLITGHNIAPEKRVEGKIEGYEETLVETGSHYTTDWFDVDEEGKYLTMSGGFNCAIWQFKDNYGLIVASATSENRYRVSNEYGVNVYQMARVRIPEGAIRCRVTYFNTALESTTAVPDEELTIIYGRLPGESRKAQFSTYDIPDLKEGEKIVYDEKGWRLVTENSELSLSDWEIPAIERGSYFSIGGTLPGRVSFENCEYATFEKEGIYTIRFDNNTSSAMGERMDDAKNLGFNSAVGNGQITLGENHFDNIYPWKDMKLCTVSGDKVTYEGEAGFTTDGTKGDVFVEIPKFYVKRTVDDRYDTISISGSMHEGFEVDPAFVTPNGEADKIYVAAYLTSRDDTGNLVSVSDKIPVLDMTPNELVKATEAKGDGYKEIDYAAINALQKLFMVETGLRNSQYLYMGTCAYTVATGDKENSITALNTKENTNCIDVNVNASFIEGNMVVLYDSDNYDESYPVAVEDVRQIKVIIDNNDGTYSVYFTGDPMDITAGVTAIAHVATKSGSTKSVSSHTGAMSTDRGTVGFKYRNVENLWGNAYVYIDNVKIKEGIATLTDRRGNTFELAYTLPVTASGKATDNMIRRIGYDIYHSSVLLPCEVGEGATISTYYGDMYNHRKDDKEYVLHYGGDWNAQACAGLFSYAALATEDEAYTSTTGRMMLIK